MNADQTWHFPRMNHPPTASRLLAAALLGLLLGHAIQAIAEEPARPEGTEVVIPGTQTRAIHSNIVGQDYQLQISLPRGYAESDQRYGVIYLLDAQWDFPLLYAIYGEQYYDGFVPGLIIVGILWGGENPDPNVLRLRDFTPTDEGDNGESGGADKFLAFLDKELIPYVDREFRTSGNRTLAGSSLGGLFTLYALFNRPDLFDNFIPTSPATPWDGGSVFISIAGFAERSAANPGRLFVAASELEQLRPPFEDLVSMLKERGYPGLTWTSHLVSGAGHSGVKAEGYSRGLQFAYQRPDLALSAGDRQRLLGSYRSADGSGTAVVFQREGRIWGRAPETGQEREFHARDRLDFYHPGEFMNVRFLANETGEVTGFVVETFDGKQTFRKIDDTGPD